MIENMGWIIAGVVAIMGLAAHLVKISHSQGELNQRVKTLEATAGDHREVRDAMIRLEGKFESMEAVLGELKDGLVWMTKSAPMYGPPSPPSRPARPRPAK